MPFIKVNPEEELKELNALLDSDPVARKAYDEFEREYAFRQKLAEARKSNKVTQKELHNITGLPQQSISRIEKGSAQKQSPTLRTLLKYVDALGYELSLTPKKS
ncbi:MAG: helix-turn-helix domain-containing protein [Oscillospiraceae bacterium]|nr:helix-turn-helix domain-containing protein [Oscillospiraceae bacterium]